MTSEETNMQRRSPLNIMSWFFGGVAIGILIVLIPISAGSSTDLSLTQIGFSCLLVLFCGGLSGLWGEKFIDAVAKVLNFFAF